MYQKTKKCQEIVQNSGFSPFVLLVPKSTKHPLWILKVLLEWGGRYPRISIITKKVGRRIWGQGRRMFLWQINFHTRWQLCRHTPTMVTAGALRCIGIDNGSSQNIYPSYDIQANLAAEGWGHILTHWYCFSSFLLPGITLKSVTSGHVTDLRSFSKSP